MIKNFINWLLLKLSRVNKLKTNIVGLLFVASLSFSPTASNALAPSYPIGSCTIFGFTDLSGSCTGALALAKEVYSIENGYNLDNDPTLQNCPATRADWGNGGCEAAEFPSCGFREQLSSGECACDVGTVEKDGECISGGLSINGDVWGRDDWWNSLYSLQRTFKAGNDNEYWGNKHTTIATNFPGDIPLSNGKFSINQNSSGAIVSANFFAYFPFSYSGKLNLESVGIAINTYALRNPNRILNGTALHDLSQELNFDPLSRTQSINSIKNNNNWSATSALARTIVDVLNSGEPILVEQESVSGPTTSPGGTVITKTDTGSTTATKRTYNNTYDGATVDLRAVDSELLSCTPPTLKNVVLPDSFGENTTQSGSFAYDANSCLESVVSTVSVSSFESGELLSEHEKVFDQLSTGTNINQSFSIINLPKGKYNLKIKAMSKNIASPKYSVDFTEYNGGPTVTGDSVENAFNNAALYLVNESKTTLSNFQYYPENGNYFYVGLNIPINSSSEPINETNSTLVTRVFEVKKLVEQNSYTISSNKNSYLPGELITVNVVKTRGSCGILGLENARVSGGCYLNWTVNPLVGSESSDPSVISGTAPIGMGQIITAEVMKFGENGIASVIETITTEINVRSPEALTGEVVIGHISGAIPLRQTFSLNIASISVPSLKSVDWYISRDNQTFAPLGLSGRQGIFTFNNAGIYYLKGKMIKREGDIESFTNTVSFVVSQSYKISLAGNNLALPGTLVRQTASVKNSDGTVADLNDLNFVWEAIGHDGSKKPLAGEDFIDFQSDVPGKYIISVRVKSKNMDSSDPKSWFEATSSIVFLIPNKPTVSIKGLRSLEVSTTGEFNATVRLPWDANAKTSMRVVGKWTLPDGVTVVDDELKLNHLVKESDGKNQVLTYTAWVEGLESTTTTVVTHKFSTTTYVFPNQKLSAVVDSTFAPAYVRLSVIGKTPADVKSLAGKRLTYTWHVPTVDFKGTVNGSSLRGIADKPGNYPFNLVITDTRGNSQTLNYTLTLTSAAPSVLSMKLVQAQKFNRNPMTYAVKHAVAGGHPKDRVQEYVLSVDGVDLPAQKGSTKLVTINTSGTHEIGLRIKTVMGVIASTSKTVVVNQNAVPVCTLAVMWDTHHKTARVAPKCKDPDGRIKKMVWFLDGVQPARSSNYMYFSPTPAKPSAEVKLKVFDDSGEFAEVVTTVTQ